MGGFNELVPVEHDWDLWKRFARAGAAFIFPPLKSGRYHVRSDSLSRSPRLTRQQRDAVETNWNNGRAIYEDRTVGGGSSCLPRAQRRVERIAFASPWCLADYTSETAMATCQTLRYLAQLRFQCRAFCGAWNEAADEGALGDILVRQEAPWDSRNVQISGYTARLHRTALGDVPLIVFHGASSPGCWASDEELNAFYRAYARFLDQDRPDAVVIFGGDRVVDMLARLAKRRDISVVFALHDLASDAQAFTAADYVLVSSEFSRRYHWEGLGLACHALPCVIDPQRAGVGHRQPEFVAFVNPQPIRGLYVFSRIAEVLARRRPDIPLLVMVGRNQQGWQEETGIDLGRLPNVTIRPSTSDPREFYAVTKVLVMPSLWNESFGLVAAEAMLNGIPVLASNRGALAETVGDGGFLFDIPARYTPQSRELPTAEEVEPWITMILRLWDDAEFYRQSSKAARSRAECWRPERTEAVYREFFTNVAPQPGPPIVPKTADLRGG